MSALIRSSALSTSRRLLSTSATRSLAQATHKPSDPPPAKLEHPATTGEPARDLVSSAYTSSHAVIPEDHISPDVIPAGIVSGAPIDLQSRTVRIFKSAKSAMQSSNHRGRNWRMDWDVMSKGHRWENPLMGWQSSADYMQGTSLTFRSKEDAIAFAERQGYEYYVQEPKVREIKSKAYANNFTWSAGKLKKIHTK